MKRSNAKHILISMFIVLISISGFMYGCFFKLPNNKPIKEQPVGTYEPISINYKIDNSYKSGITASINNDTLSWDNINTNYKGDYYVVYFGNDFKTDTLKTKNNTISITEIIGDTVFDIIGFRVGVLNIDTLSLSDTVYYNNENSKPYSDQIFYFMGRFGDYIANDLRDLTHIVHYNFIKRNTNISIKLTKEYAESLGLTNVFTGASKAFGQEVENIFNSELVDTIAVSYNYGIKNKLTNEVTISINYRGGEVPVRTLTPFQVQDKLAKPYYMTKEFAKRDASFNNFKTDNNILVASVSTSEELFWAIEDGQTPIFTDTTSTAYKTYKMAKNILKEIISDDMSDYEKVLSIFDFVTYSTVYDKKIAHKNYEQYLIESSDVFTMYGSFYLEGVFNDFVAVCDGFSKAFSLLSNMEGIRTVRIVGDAGGGHAWNKVLIDNNWYVVDITWTELEAKDYITETPTEYLSHKYFLVSDSDIKTHTAHSSQNYKNYEANKNYNYYFNTTFNVNNKTKNLVIESISDAYDLLDYLWYGYLSDGNEKSIEALFTSYSISNWANWVKSYKSAYNLKNPSIRFDNDILKIYDGSYLLINDTYNLDFKEYEGKQYSVSVVQIKSTKLNLIQKQ